MHLIMSPTKLVFQFPFLANTGDLLPAVSREQLVLLCYQPLELDLNLASGEEAAKPQSRSLFLSLKILGSG